VRTALLLVVGVAAVSLSGPLMAAMVVPPLAIAFWRNAFATAALGPAVLMRRRQEVTTLDGPRLRLLVASGVALAVHFATWVTSLTLTSVASATALVCLQIGWVALWELLRGERFGRLMTTGMVLAFTGVLVVSGVDLSLSTRALAGDLCALVGGAAAAVYTVIGSRARRTTTTTTYTFVCYGVCAVVLAAASLVAGQALGGYPLDQWGLLLLVTVTAQLMGHSAFNHVVARVGPVVVSLVLLLEVPGAALLAALILGQRPPPEALLGLGIILAGMVAVVLGGRAAAEAKAVVEPPFD
jgi:drug/metabolite transporter (DMT)-like permease